MTNRKAPRPERRADEDACAPATPDAAPDAAPLRNEDESPLAWLARRKDKDGQPMIAEPELTAGERLRSDFYFAQMTPRITANWSLLMGAGGGKPGSPDMGAEVSDAVHAAQHRVRRALAAVGPELAGVLIDVCCHLRGLEWVERQYKWRRGVAKHMLLVALRQLARHYGILSDTDPRAATPRAINQWGVEGYKPSVDGGEGEE